MCLRKTDKSSQPGQPIHYGKQLMQLQTWYALGVLILILRHIVRLRTVGLQGYQGDDYLSILVCFLYWPQA